MRSNGVRFVAQLYVTFGAFLNVLGLACLICLAPVGLASCGTEPELDEQALELSTPVILPSAPPVCDKDTNSLTVFADYTAAACVVTISGKLVNTCLECQADVECPRGAACINDASGSKHCGPAQCTSDAECSNGPGAGVAFDKKHCNETTHRCEYLTCGADSICPCGSYCDAGSGRCRLDCSTGVGAAALNLSCNGTLTCDTRGRCSSTLAGGGTEIPLAEVVLAAAPAAIALPTDPSAIVTLTVTLSTTDVAVGTRAPRTVRVVPPPGMLVSCDPLGPLSPSACTIAGADWIYGLAGGRYTASRVARMTIQPGTAATQWMLNLVTDDEAEHTLVAVTRTLPKQQIGRYRGLLTIGSGAPETRLPVEATVTDTRVLLHDPSRFIAATGTAQLLLSGAEQTTSFLGSSKQRSLYNKAPVFFGLRAETLAFDPAAGRLTGALGVRLGTSPTRQDTWTFTLDRVADLTSAMPCPSGDVFDSGLNVCVPGERWDPGPGSAPSVTHPTASRWLDVMAPRLGDTLLSATGAEPLAERLLCFDANIPSSNAGFLTSSLAVSGDLKCAGATGHNWWGVGLVGFQDRGPVSPALTQVDMLTDCLQQLTAPVPTTISANSGVPAITNSSCVSLPRFMPALFAVAGTTPYRLDTVAGGSASDGRSRLLFLRLLQQWTQLTGFIARNGTEQKGVADLLTQLRDLTGPEGRVRDATQGVTFGSLLDVVDNAWTLILDRRIHGPLVAIPPQAIASPDYRQLNRPTAYWTFAGVSGSTVGDVIAGGHDLNVAGCSVAGGWLIGGASCAPQVSIPGLAGNVSLAFKLFPNLAPGTASTIIDSDALVVRLVHPASPATPSLQVGHRTSDGTFETRSIPLVGGFNTNTNNYFVLTRDTRTGYALYYGPVGLPVVPVAEVLSASLRVGRAATTSLPEPASDQLRVGASRTTPAQNLNGKLSEVAIWDSSLSRTEAEQLITNYFKAVARPAWPSDVTLPSPSNLDANEATVGLPATLLESLIATMHLIDAYVQDAMVTNLVSCRAGHVDDAVQRAKERAGRSLRMGYAIQQLAESLYASALQAGALAWEERYNQALTEMLAARAKAIQSLAGAGACENPIGLGPTEFPLYFGDTRSLFNAGPLDLLEASALYLKREAGSIGGSPGGAIGDAAAALADARVAWTMQYTSAVQEQASSDTTRLDDIRSSFGRELIDLCGVPVSGTQEAATVVARFLNADDPRGHLTPQDCYIQKETPGCAGSEHKPLGMVDPACFRGQVGEAWNSARAASLRVTRAQLVWEDARSTHNRWLAHCAGKQRGLGLENGISDKLREFESSESKESSYFGMVKGAADAVVGYFTDNPQQAIGGVVGLVRSGLDLARGIADKKAKLEQLLQRVVEHEAMRECWFQAGIAGLPVGVAEQDITSAAADLQSALSHVATLQNHLSATAVEAGAAIAREQGKLRPRLAFHYWAQEKLEIFQRRMARARRMTYLYLRAVEHDLQRNFQLDDDVMGAVHPEQLNHVSSQLSGFLSNGIEKRLPERKHTVLSLCQDVLRLPEHNSEQDCDKPKSAQRFRELLFSPANAMYKEDGTYLGQAIPFALTPSIASLGQPAVFSRCAERLAEVDVNFVNDAASSMPVMLAKRETFYSDTCADHIGQIGPFQEGTLRSSSNLLVESVGAHFGRDFEWARADITALPFDQRFIDHDTVGTNAVRALGGRGVYGNYALIVPPGTLRALVANPGSLRDFKIRFDYVSVPDLGAVAPPGTNQLMISYLDGENRPLTNLNGNSVAASCTSNCSPETISNLSATAASGWHFGGWSGACAGSGTTCSVPMSSNRQVWATFVDDRVFNLTVSKAGAGSGSVTSGWLGAGGGPLAEIPPPLLPLVQDLPTNVPVFLTAAAAPGSTFAGWSGGVCSGTSSTCVIPAASAVGTKNVIATFTVNALPPMLTIVRAGAWESWNDLHGFGVSELWNGGEPPTGQEIPCHDYVCTAPFTQGTALNLGARLRGPGPGGPPGRNNLVRISGPDCNTGPSVPHLPGACNVLMDTNRSVIVGHSPWSNLEIAFPSNGRVFSQDGFISCGFHPFESWDRCSRLLETGSSLLLFASPVPGYQVAGWGGVGGCTNTTSCLVPMNATYGPVNLTVSFAPLPPPPPVCTPREEQLCCGCTGRCNCQGTRVCRDDGSGWGSCRGSVCAPNSCD